MSTLALFFAWPAGQVWPNLVASAITSAGTASLVARRFLVKLRAERAKDHAARAVQLAEHHQAVAETVAKQLAEHHQAVLAAVRPQEGGGS